MIDIGKLVIITVFCPWIALFPSAFVKALEETANPTSNTESLQHHLDQ